MVRKHHQEPVRHKACTSVGITNFVTDRVFPSQTQTTRETFYGTLKSNTSDFIVREIDKHGVIADIFIEHDDVAKKEDKVANDDDYNKPENSAKQTKLETPLVDKRTPLEKYQQTVEVVNCDTKYEELLGSKGNKDQINNFAKRILNNRKHTRSIIK